MYRTYLIIRLAVIDNFWQSLCNLILFLASVASRCIAVLMVLNSFSDPSTRYLYQSISNQELQFFGIIFWGLGYIIQTARRFFVIRAFEINNRGKRNSTWWQQYEKIRKITQQPRVIARIGLGFYLFIFAQFCLIYIFVQSNVVVVIVLATGNLLIIWQLLHKTEQIVLRIKGTSNQRRLALSFARCLGWICGYLDCARCIGSNSNWIGTVSIHCLPYIQLFAF